MADERNNGRKGVAIPLPQQEAPAAQMTIRAWANRPPEVVCTGTIVEALRLLGVAAMQLANSIEQQQAPPQEPVQDKKREYLGPRKYGEEED